MNKNIYICVCIYICIHILEPSAFRHAVLIVISLNVLPILLHIFMMKFSAMNEAKRNFRHERIDTGDKPSLVSMARGGVGGKAGERQAATLMKSRVAATRRCVMRMSSSRPTDPLQASFVKIIANRRRTLQIVRHFCFTH
jgi:hypothetical protein